MASFRSLHRSGLMNLAQRTGTRAFLSPPRITASVLSRPSVVPHRRNNGPRSKPFRLGPQQQQCRYYTPMTPEEEAKEKERVKNLTPFAKEQELRKLNREIARLQMLHGINTGELYTWTGRYKVLARDYGFPLVAWYASVWGLTAVAIYTGIELGGIDAMALVAKFDSYTGYELANHIDPQLGKIGLTLLVNEMIEPIRLPVVIVTVKPVMDRLFPPKF